MQIVAIIVSLGITAVAVAMAVIAVRQMLGVIRTGQPAVGRTDAPRQRLATMFKETLGHTRMLQWHWVGIMHWFVMLGFIFLSSLVFGAYLLIFDAGMTFPLIGTLVIYEWPVEVLSWLTLIGILYLILVRQKNHPRQQGRRSRFFGSNFWQAYFVEAVILAVVVLGTVLRTLEYALVNNAEYLDKHPEAADHNGLFHFPTTAWIGELWTGLSLSTLENLIWFLAMLKIVVSMTWLIVISRNITMGVAWHRFTAWFNIYFKREASGRTALGAVKPLTSDGKAVTLDDIDDLDEDATLGVGKAEDFSWKGILDFTTCTECGRCQSQCPAWNTEKPLSPKLLITALRDHTYAKARGEERAQELALVGGGDRSEEGGSTGADDWFYNPEGADFVIDEDVLWSCTTCGACVQQCPVDIEHVDHIVDMRRYQILVESNFPAELNGLFKGLENKGNPWNMSSTARLDWTKGLDFEVKVVGDTIESLDEVDWLFWVGCAGAYEDRAKKTTRAVAELLDIAGVSFGVLGNGETCTGDPARRAGNEFVFQGLALQNAEVLTEAKAKKVVSTCAHCFNTLKNEYQAFGVELEVVHHTQLLNRLVREGKLTPVQEGPGAQKRSITYHDPCYIGRHNGVYTPPRELLQVLPGATYVEMERHSERSFCCGAGGARMWMEENIGERINMNRTDEAVATGADQIAVGCPFCRVMLSDGLTMKQSKDEAREEVEILDVAQMLLASVKGEQATKLAPGGAPKEAAPAARASDDDVATKAEPEAGDETITDDTVVDTADVGPAAKASGGTSLFDDDAAQEPQAQPTDAPTAEKAGGSLFDDPETAEGGDAAGVAKDVDQGTTTAPEPAGSSLFDLGEESDSEGAEGAEGATETAPEAEEAVPEARTEAETPGLASGGSLFDVEEPAAEAPSAPAASDDTDVETEVQTTDEAEPEPATPVEEPAPAAPPADLGSAGSLFDIAAPEAAPARTSKAEAKAEPAKAAEPAATEAADPEAEPQPPATPEEKPEAKPEAAPSTTGAASTPGTEIPDSGSLFDLPEPEGATAPAKPATAPAEDAAPAAEPEPEPAAPAEPADEAPEEPEAVTPPEPAPAAAPGSGEAIVPGTEIPESGSLFDLPEPEATVAAPKQAAPAPAPTGSEPEPTPEPEAEPTPEPEAEPTPEAEAEPTPEPVEAADAPEAEPGADADRSPDGIRDGAPGTLSGGAAVSAAATATAIVSDGPAVDDETETDAVEVPVDEAEPEADEPKPAPTEAATGAGAAEAAAEAPEKPKAASNGEAHTPQTDVEIGEGSLFDL